MALWNIVICFPSALRACSTVSLLLWSCCCHSAFLDRLLIVHPLLARRSSSAGPAIWKSCSTAHYCFLCVFQFVGGTCSGIQTASSCCYNLIKNIPSRSFQDHSSTLRTTKLKYFWIQDEVKEGKLELKKVRTHFNPSDVLTKYVPASVLGQHLPRLNIFKVNSKGSAAKRVQYSSHTLNIIDVDAGDVVSLRGLLQQLQCSRRTSSRVQTSFKEYQKDSQTSSSRERRSKIFKEIHLFIVVVMSFIMILMLKRIRELE